jgi:hypothetical protein
MRPLLGPPERICARTKKQEGNAQSNGARIRGYRIETGQGATGRRRAENRGVTVPPPGIGRGLLGEIARLTTLTTSLLGDMPNVNQQKLTI